MFASCHGWPEETSFPPGDARFPRGTACQPASQRARTSSVKIQPPPPPALLYNEGTGEGNSFEVLHPADTLSRAQLLFTSPAGTNCTIPTAFCTLRRPLLPSSFLRRGFRERGGGGGKAARPPESIRLSATRDTPNTAR